MGVGEDQHAAAGLAQSRGTQNATAARKVVAVVRAHDDVGRSKVADQHDWNIVRSSVVEINNVSGAEVIHRHAVGPVQRAARIPPIRHAVADPSEVRRCSTELHLHVGNVGDAEGRRVMRRRREIRRHTAHRAGHLRQSVGRGSAGRTVQEVERDRSGGVQRQVAANQQQVVDATAYSG